MSISISPMERMSPHRHLEHIGNVKMLYKIQNNFINTFIYLFRMVEGTWQTAGGATAKRNEPSFEDPEDYVDDISNEELMPDLMARAPREADGIENVVIISNIPKTAKIGKLKEKLAKTWQEKAGLPVTSEYPTEMSKDEKTGEMVEMTKGYCFLEFEDEETALKAADELNEHKFDRKHTFSANLFTDFEKFERTADEWNEPTRKPYEDLGDLYQHMQDPDAFDQFVVTYDDGRMTQVHSLRFSYRFGHRNLQFLF